MTAAAAFAGPPSVAHAEALLRAVELRRAELDGPLDAIVIGVPGTTPYLPREGPNPLLAAYLGLGLALRLWRDAFPVVDGGTAILAHRFTRTFAHPTQTPYRPFFHAARIGRDPEMLAEAERAAASNPRGIADYRNGRTVHPLLPFRDWNACQPALGRLGCRPRRRRGATPPPSGSSASFPCTASVPRSTSPAGARAARRASASSSARRTSRCASVELRSRRDMSCGPARSARALSRRRRA